MNVINNLLFKITIFYTGSIDIDKMIYLIPTSITLI